MCGVLQLVLFMSCGIIFDFWEDMWMLFEGLKFWVDIVNVIYFMFFDGQILFQVVGENFVLYEDLLDRIVLEQMVRILVGYIVFWMKGVFIVKGG